MAKATHRMEACLPRSKTKRVWLRMRDAMGPAGRSLKRCRSWPHGFWGGRRSGGKTWPPALTLAQMRQGMAVILREAFQCGTRSPMVAERQKRWRRHELARFYHWKQREAIGSMEHT